MHRDTFWQIIDAARAEAGDSVTDPDAVAEAVVDRLAALTPDDIVGFQRVYDQLEDESYRWNLWAAAYVMLGGCSDDSFDYFRGWLVAQGRAVWEAALADPDSLAGLPDVLDAPGDCEEMLGAASSAYGRVTGDADAFWAALKAADGSDGGDGPADDAMGEDFDFDDEEEMRRRLPRLTALYFDDDD